MKYTMLTVRKLLSPLLVRFFILSVALLVLITQTAPEDIGPQGIVGFFILFYAWCFATVKLLVRFLTDKDKFSLFNEQHFFPIALVSGFLPMLLALSSLRQLSWIDSVILGAVICVGVFYWIRKYKK